MIKYFRIKFLINSYFKLSEIYLKLATLQSGFKKDRNIYYSEDCLEEIGDLLKRIL